MFNGGTAKKKKKKAPLKALKWRVYAVLLCEVSSEQANVCLTHFQLRMSEQVLQAEHVAAVHDVHFREGARLTGFDEPTP
jgi:hypothetical protein